MKVGDYVRNKYGITQIKENVYLLVEAIKSSPNIIDLIEVGDYVNGSRVIRIEKSSYLEDNKKLIIICEDSDDYNSYFEEEIKSIVTKEQFESMKYRIGE